MANKSNCAMARYDGYRDGYDCTAPECNGASCYMIIPSSPTCSIYQDWEREERERMGTLNKVDVRILLHEVDDMTAMVSALSKNGYKIGVHSDDRDFEVTIYKAERIDSEPMEYLIID